MYFETLKWTDFGNVLSRSIKGLGEIQSQNIDALRGGQMEVIEQSFDTLCRQVRLASEAQDAKAFAVGHADLAQSNARAMTAATNRNTEIFKGWYGATLEWWDRFVEETGKMTLKPFA
ncbi:MAG: phasin family protein [Gammaproteobacteria bacterium]